MPLILDLVILARHFDELNIGYALYLSFQIASVEPRRVRPKPTAVEDNVQSGTHDLVWAAVVAVGIAAAAEVLWFLLSALL